MVELAGGLVVPATPGGTTILGDQGPLVGAEDLAGGIPRVDPQGVEIIAGGIAFERDEVGAGIGAFQHDGVHDIDDIRVGGIGGDAGEIPAALGDAGVGGDARPGGT